MRPPKYQSPSGRPMRQCRYLKVPFYKYVPNEQGEFFIVAPNDRATEGHYDRIEGVRRCQSFIIPGTQYCRMHQKKEKHGTTNS